MTSENVIPHLVSRSPGDSLGVGTMVSASNEDGGRGILGKMSMSESTGAQDWRAVACLAPGGERLLCVGESSSQGSRSLCRSLG